MAKILIIEDSPEVLECLTWVAGKLGHQVTGTYTGEEGINVAMREDFDLFISDLHLPGEISELSLIKKLRQLKPEIPLVVVSGYPADTLEECYEQGVKEFLVKPFELSFISEVIERALSGNSYEGPFD